eukprot:TRINITY_DN31217_c0_g1_i1.p1 TRINITY_DN31217_c0_g1~~TRINITY_DN31217_c0_g1_i1.p1  ORF type:complete len:261 (-),score=51.36 TRINITY_DN31217_c0_g1_i1:47-829(-)
MLRSLVGSEMCIRDSRQRREVSGLFTFRYAVYDSLTEAYQAFDSISSWAAVATFGDVIRDSRPLPERATANSSRENENSDEWCLQMVDVSTCDAIAAKGSRKMGDVNRSPNIIYSIVNAFSALPRMTQSGIYIACTMLADEVIVSSEGWSVFMVGIPTHKKKVRLEGEERRLALAARSAAAAASSSSSAVVSGGAAASSSSSSYTCLLYTSDAADEEDSVDLGGRRIIKKKKKKNKTCHLRNYTNEQKLKRKMICKSTRR